MVLWSTWYFHNAQKTAKIKFSNPKWNVNSVSRVREILRVVTTDLDFGENLCHKNSFSSFDIIVIIN